MLPRPHANTHSVIVHTVAPPIGKSWPGYGLAVHCGSVVHPLMVEPVVPRPAASVLAVDVLARTKVWL